MGVILMGKHTTEMKMVETSKLIPYVNNARTHSQEQVNKLRGSLREFGFINPVIIDSDFNVIAGHGRLMAAKEEGIEEVPCVLVDYLTEAQKKAYILADNRYAQDAGWDEEMLKLEIEALEGMDFDVSLTGFDDQEIADLLAGDAEDAKDDDFDVEEEEALAYTKFISAICEMSKKQKRVTAKPKENENEKYAFRCFLLRLGFIGDEFKADRKILLSKLDGSAAFKAGAKKGGEQ